MHILDICPERVIPSDHVKSVAFQIWADSIHVAQSNCFDTVLAQSSDQVIDRHIGMRRDEDGVGQLPVVLLISHIAFHVLTLD